MIETKCENIDDNERTRGAFSTKLGKRYHVVFIRQCDTEPKAGNYVYRLLTEEEKTCLFARTRWKSWLKGPY